MIRALLLALALGACARTDAARCDLSFSREIAFTAPDAEDRLTTRAIGAACDRAVGLLTIHDAEGHPVWAWTAPIPRAFGAISETSEPDDMRAFLQTWAEPTAATTATAPDWGLLAPGQTTLDQLTYEDIRARDLPMLCHFSGTARQTCVFWEPAAGGAGHLLDRDYEEPNP